MLRYYACTTDAENRASGFPSLQRYYCMYSQGATQSVIRSTLVKYEPLNRHLNFGPQAEYAKPEDDLQVKTSVVHYAQKYLYAFYGKKEFHGTLNYGNSDVICL
jgi:hypothetical protein